VGHVTHKDVVNDFFTFQKLRKSATKTDAIYMMVVF